MEQMLMSQVLSTKGLQLAPSEQKYDTNNYYLNNLHSLLNNCVKGSADYGGAFVIFGSI